MVEVGRTKEHVERTVHKLDVRGFHVQVGPAIQKDIDTLAAAGNGEVMPIVVNPDAGAALLSPLHSWAIVDRGAGSEVQPGLKDPQHPAGGSLDVGDPLPGFVAGEILYPLAEFDPHFHGKFAVEVNHSGRVRQLHTMIQSVEQ